MTQKNQVYKCPVCGIISEVIHSGVGQLFCCGQNMSLLKENTEEAATEKHVPVIKKTEDGIEVTVGSVEHPMIDTHFIEWIEVITDNKVYREELNPGSEPKATFPIKEEDIIMVREYCNLHGLWKAE